MAASATPRAGLALSLRRPDDAARRGFLAACQARDFNYPEPGMVEAAAGVAPAAWTEDVNSRELGSGDAVWSAARAAVDACAMFEMPWIELCRGGLGEGDNVATLTRHFGVWALNPCRIVRRIDEPSSGRGEGMDRFGFVYGTIAGHLMEGEERFLVERAADGRVRLEIRAWSRPGHPLSRLLRPYQRYLQRCFGREAPDHFKQAVEAAVRPISP